MIAPVRNGEFDPAHAIIVRPLRTVDGGEYQIISGHNRVLAAGRALVDTVPAWVREMDDGKAYMELVRANAQGELTALERGMHALGFVEQGKHGKSVAAYAELSGRPGRTAANEYAAAEVAEKFADIGKLSDLIPHFSHLVEIHAAPAWLWGALVEYLLTEKATVDTMRKGIGTALSAMRLTQRRSWSAMIAANWSACLRSRIRWPS